jgi:hypothetical protein
MRPPGIACGKRSTRGIRVSSSWVSGGHTSCETARRAIAQRLFSVRPRIRRMPEKYRVDGTREIMKRKGRAAPSADSRIRLSALPATAWFGTLRRHPPPTGIFLIYGNVGMSDGEIAGTDELLRGRGFDPSGTGCAICIRRCRAPVSWLFIQCREVGRMMPGAFSQISRRFWKGRIPTECPLRQATHHIWRCFGRALWGRICDSVQVRRKEPADTRRRLTRRVRPTGPIADIPGRARRPARRWRVPAEPGGWLLWAIPCRTESQMRPRSGAARCLA